MYQQQNYTNYYPQRTISLKGRPVTSLDEAKASPIDFNGTGFYFPDVANNCIYTKQINMDGTASLKMYVLQEMPVENLNGVNTSAFITRDEFESVINQLRMSLTPTQKEENNPVTQF